VRVRESLDCRYGLQRVRHLHRVRRLGVLFHAPLDLHNLAAFGKKLAIGGNTLALRIHHHVIGDDHFQLVFRLTDRDTPLVFVSSEIGKREMAQFQRVSVLLRNGDASEDSERRGTDQSQRDDPGSHVKSPLRLQWMMR
jgi:hypothetical protein